MYLVLGYSEVVALAIGGVALAIRGVALVVTQLSRHQLLPQQLEQLTAVPVCELFWVGRVVGLGWQ